MEQQAADVGGRSPRRPWARRRWVAPWWAWGVAVAGAWAALAGPAWAGKVPEDMRCAVDARTDAYQCVRGGEIRERDGIRQAPLYRGGPAVVRPTGFTVHANCRTRVLHVKDRDGVSFGGGYFGDSDMMRQLGEALCR